MAIALAVLTVVIYLQLLSVVQLPPWLDVAYFVLMLLAATGVFSMEARTVARYVLIWSGAALFGVLAVYHFVAMFTPR